MHAIITVCGALLLLFSQCSAQAPGDEDDRCLKSPYVHTYEDDVKILMDSYNYLQLLPGNGTGNPPIASALWNDKSFDGNDIISTTAATYWQQNAGTCQFNIKVCGFRQPGATQDNWLFTQHISKSFDANTNNYPVEILVDITYALQSCRDNRNPSCNTRFKLYHYITNSQQLPSTSGSGFMNKDNYMSFGTATPLATGARYTETHRFTLQPQQTGFYIAIEDRGTCVIVSRLLVYRHSCKSMQTGLVLYPETPAPVSGSSNDPTNIDITCVDNADVCGSPEVTCDSDGMWGSQNPRCGCRAGYEDRGTVCRACQSGYYSPCDGCQACVDNGCADRSCCPCPANTKTDQVAAAQCECLDDYFRNTESRESTNGAQAFVSAADEQPSTGCTQPPSAPTGLTVAAVSSVSVFVQWSIPAQTGGRPDLYYQVEHSDPDNLGTFINTEYDDSTSHTFNNLRPATQYCVRVSAHNGVSDQDPDDPDGAQLRTAEECATTPEDTPGAPVDLQVVYPAVVWQPPVNPNGVIINYDLTFRRGGQSRTVTTTGDQTYYVIRTQDIPGSSGEFTVEVRARNGAGSGPFSERIVVADNTICPTCPPTTTTTCPDSGPDCDVCPARAVGLVRYPATLAPVSGTQSVTTQCVENAQRTSSSLSVTCSSTGSWSGQTPQCQCDTDYEEITDQSGNRICQGPDCDVCPARAEGLVRYPATLAPVSGTQSVTTQCVENAQRTSSSLSVTCSSTGSWSGQTPQCQCDTDYEEITDQSGNRICQGPDCDVCPARAEGLVRYPATLAPVSGTQSVTTQCVENAHRTSSSLSVTCSSTGSWGNQTPRCQCDTGYQEITDQSGNRICQVTIPERITISSDSSYPFVVWSPPTNTEVASYELKFTRAGESSTRTSTVPYYVISDSDIPGTSGSFTVEVRGRNSAGIGSYSPRITMTPPVEPPTPATCPTTDCPTCSTPTPPTIRQPGAVNIDDITVLGCGAISWKPPRDTGGELPGYIVRFFDGATYGTSVYKEIQRSFVDDPGRQWAIAENLPSGRTAYADIRAQNSAGVSPYSEKIVVTDTCTTISPELDNCPTTTPCPTCPSCPDCRDCDVCPARAEGLVRYPATLAPVSGTQSVTTQCVENAHRTSSSLSVTCSSTGSWGNQTPRCQCDTGYEEITDQSGNRICQVHCNTCPTCPTTTTTTCPDCDVCPARAEGLVRYPATLAPVSGTQSVTTQCVENAHRTSSSLSVTCSSTGSWGNQTPQCQCDTGYEEITDRGNRICEVTCPTPPTSTCTCPDIQLPGAVHIDDITVLGCGVISWKPPRDTGGELPGYIVRFFDGATYGTSVYKEIQRSFVDDPGRQWAIAQNLPSGRTAYADIRAQNSAGVSPYSERIVVADNTICATCPPTVTCPPTNTTTSCRLGQYAISGGSCSACPTNTQTNQVAVDMCQCQSGYLRNDVILDSSCSSMLSDSNEGAGSGCTQPPSKPTSVTVTTTSTTSITVSWSRPNQNGGRSDLYYTVERSDIAINRLGVFTDMSCKGSTSTSRTFTDLRPATQYCIRVSAHNGVSDQDPDGLNGRSVIQCIRTHPGTNDTVPPCDSCCAVQQPTIPVIPDTIQNVIVLEGLLHFMWEPIYGAVNYNITYTNKENFESSDLVFYSTTKNPFASMDVTDEKINIFKIIYVVITTVVDNNSGRKRRDVSTISSQPLEVDLEELRERECDIKSMQVDSENSSVDGTSIGISISITFVATGSAFSFLVIVIALVLHTHAKKKQQKKVQANVYGYAQATSDKTNL